MNRQRTEGFQGSVNTLMDDDGYIIIHLDNDGYMSLYICPNYTTPRVNTKVNYELQVIMMCQCRFILVKKEKEKVPLW